MDLQEFMVGMVSRITVPQFKNFAARGRENAAAYRSAIAGKQGECGRGAEALLGQPEPRGMSWCDQNWNLRRGLGFDLNRRGMGRKTRRASAEDRALRGRNPSAAGSLIDGQSGRRKAARLALAGISFHAKNPAFG